MDELEKKENPILEKSEAAKREEEILKFWNENKIFQKTLEKESPAGEFVFYEGPPTANGKPGIHHLESRAFKDAIPRYKTMRGYHVRRKGGWDTHGLPVELQVEKKLNLNSKKAIEEYGIAKFNRECKESVWEYVDLWSKFTERIGYWIDQENPYVTYHNDYIESLWHILKTVQQKELLYKDYKVVPWCPRCGTALSSHELAQGYETVKDLSVYVKFELVKNPDLVLPLDEKDEKLPIYLLAWTTTPWTLPGNVGLAVKSDIDYVTVRKEDEAFYCILAKSRLEVLPEGYRVYSEYKGSLLVGQSYKSLYPFLNDTVSESEKPKLANAWKVYEADFVTTEDGTGIVHTAVMYGQDDFELGTKASLPKHHLVGLDGTFLPGTGFLAGKFVKDENTAVDIIKDLAGRGLLYKKEKYEHSYPHCWRCHTPLIYYARDSWYIRMSSLRDTLVKENEGINWEPAHIKEGRFGEWLREVKDWAISRERYWGTPLPVWTNDIGAVEVIGSLSELREKMQRSGNTYFVMRHGGTEGNAKGVVSFKAQAEDNLTEEGKQGVEKSIQALGKKIDLIVCSPFTRTRETAEIVRKTLGLSIDDVKFEEGLHEINPGEFDGKSWDTYHEYIYQTGPGWFDRKIPEGESLSEVKVRTGKVLYELEEKYQHKNILIITHGAPAWLLFVNAGLHEPDDKDYQKADTRAFVADFKRFDNAEIRELPFVPMPHDENYNLDLHRPYIDEVKLIGEDGSLFTRTKEVMDVWFDSGGMPFAEDHYPFENGKYIDTKGYPADFISEAIDQTRGWFYTLHAVGILMGRGKAFQNVICLGHILDKDGKKMSKSLGNIIDPWTMIEKYGVDALRFWMYSVNQPGDSKNFDERTVDEIVKKVFNLLQNIYTFYTLYAEENTEALPTEASENILDRWILARLDELMDTSTKHLDSYKLFEPVRAVRDFVDDFSTWYLRRSRERFKGDDARDKLFALSTTRQVLLTLAKCMAPFTPFFAEKLYQDLTNGKLEESVHLENWPETMPVTLEVSNVEIIEEMEKTRALVTLGLEARQKAGLKVRQPLNELKVKNLTLQDEYLELVKDELNVKSVSEDGSIEGEVLLDTVISDALKEEGIYRELVRTIQDLRKKQNLTPKDTITLSLSTSSSGQKIIEIYRNDLEKAVLAREVTFVDAGTEKVIIEGIEFSIRIEK